MIKDRDIEPKKVTEMADFIKDCDNNNYIPVIIQSRRWGRTAAFRLARQTEDAKIIEPKQLPNSNTIEDEK